MKESSVLFRYTDIPGAVYMLQTKKLTLLNPESWDDANDSHFLKLYKSARQLTCLAALCFSEADETYHHWRIFAAGSSGVRIEFDRERLFAALDFVPEIRREKVVKGGVKVDQCGGAKGSHFGPEKGVGLAGGEGLWSVAEEAFAPREARLVGWV